MKDSWRRALRAFAVTVLILGCLAAFVTVMLREGLRADERAVSEWPSRARGELDHRPTGPPGFSLSYYRDGSFQPGAFEGEPAPTKSAAQSKLWHHDGAWWGLLVDSARSVVTISELTRRHTWRSTGVTIDTRVANKADVQLRRNSLYVVSGRSIGRVLFSRFSYDRDDRTWRREPGYPTMVARHGARSATVTIDSKGRVWATWLRGARALFSVSANGGRTWWPARRLPGPSQVTNDDVAAIVAAKGSVGVLWSDQKRGAFHYLSRRDSMAIGEWSKLETPISGRYSADGHIKLVADPASGTIYAAVKTSYGDHGEPVTSPLLLVLTRTRSGRWTSVVAATIADNMTRPQIVLTAGGKRLLWVAASPQRGGALYYKMAETSRLGFGPGRGTLFLTGVDATISNPTTTKQLVNGKTGWVVLASDDAAGRYYHSELPLDSR